MFLLEASVVVIRLNIYEYAFKIYHISLDFFSHTAKM
jgi:hypothetical protein